MRWWQKWWGNKLNEAFFQFHLLKWFLKVSGVHTEHQHFMYSLKNSSKMLGVKFFGTFEHSHSAVCCCLVRKHKAAYLASGQLGGLIFRSPYLITSHPHLHHCVNSIIWSPIGFGRCCTFTLHSLLAHEGSVQLLCPDDLEIGSTEKKS